ncbi:MAG: sigma-70 family RNA polymerase sigma factor [Actinomycetota bacterium]
MNSATIATDHRSEQTSSGDADERPRHTRGNTDHLEDDALMDLVREGQHDVYAVLWARHYATACSYARSLTRSGHDVDDVTAEAFTRLLALLQRGRGPSGRFLPYLLRTIRNLAMDGHRRDQRIDVSDEIDGESGPGPADHLVEREERDVARRAFDRLPDAWRGVLWDVEVLAKKPAEVAQATSTTAHNVSALACRARKGLRHAFLSENVAPAAGPCRRVTERLGAFLCDEVGLRERRRIDEHLDWCARCRAAESTIRDIAADAGIAVRPPLEQAA